MDSKIESMVASCEQCAMFKNKTTHEPLQPHNTSDSAWKDVSVDLFGPMPDRRHVIAVIDKASRFPAAKIVPNTSNTAVTGALSQIYADYGQPETHQTDNGPPFNSEGFAKFSTDNGIHHIKTYPYHPQGNPVENFMRPIGTCMKTAHHQRVDKSQALNDMLSSYRATPTHQQG
jgi:transposase InsO family protein